MYMTMNIGEKKEKRSAKLLSEVYTSRKHWAFTIQAVYVIVEIATVLIILQLVVCTIKRAPIQGNGGVLFRCFFAEQTLIVFLIQSKNKLNLLDDILLEENSWYSVTIILERDSGNPIFPTARLAAPDVADRDSACGGLLIAPTTIAPKTIVPTIIAPTQTMTALIFNSPKCRHMRLKTIIFRKNPLKWRHQAISIGLLKYKTIYPFGENNEPGFQSGQVPVRKGSISILLSAIL